MRSVVNYIDELKREYSNIIINSSNNWYTISSSVTEKTNYFAFVEELGAKKFVLKKGSLIYPLNKYDAKNNNWSSSYIKYRDKRVSIKTKMVELSGRNFDMVVEDFECTSKSIIAMFVCLVVGATTYINKIDKREMSMVKEAEHSLTSDNSSSADKLSEKAQQQSADIAQRIYEENRERERLEYEKQLKSFKYAFNESRPYIEKQLMYNQSKMDMALSGLETNQTVYITGLSRSGKTFLCKEIAGKFCNVDTSNIKHKAVYYNNLMWVSCNMDIDKFTRKLAEFCVHNKNNKCLLVINEATKDKLCELLPMWEDMDAEGKNYKEFLYSEKGLDFECDGEIIKVPKGLCILANVADGQNVHDLTQVVNRFVNHINMNEITDDIVYLSRYTGIRQDIFEFLIEMQNTILSQYENEDAFIAIYKLKYETLRELKRYYKHGMTYYEDLAKLDILKKYIEELEYAGA